MLARGSRSSSRSRRCAVELHAVELLRFRQPDHGVGELDLAAGAALLGFQNLEDLRLQDVAPGDRQVRRRRALAAAFPPCRRPRTSCPVALADAADAVLVRCGQPAPLRPRSGSTCSPSLLAASIICARQPRRVQHEFVRQHHARTAHRRRCSRAHHTAWPSPSGACWRVKLMAPGSGWSRAQNIELSAFLPRAASVASSSIHPVEMVLDHALVAAGDEDEMLDAGFLGLVDHILDQRLVDDRSASPSASPWWRAGRGCRDRRPGKTALRTSFMRWRAVRIKTTS